MKQRIITAIIMAAIFIPLLFLSQTIYFSIAISILSAFAVYEILCCTKHIKTYVLSVPALIFGFSAPFFSRNIFNLERFSENFYFSASAVFLFLLLFIHIFYAEKISTKDVCEVFTTAIYVTLSFTCIIKLRDLTLGGENIGKYLFLLIFISAWSTDTFAYFCGYFFGKHKLIPKISPKKTVEGAVGGIFFCVLSFIVYAIILHNNYNMSPNYLKFIFLAVITSVISQLGDLAASAIKRNYNIKDYGNIFPGHGGVLDRFDSVLAVSVFLCIFLGHPEIFSVFNF